MVAQNNKMIILLQIALIIATTSAQKNVNPCGQLYITQSPHKEKNLELNWNFTCDHPPDTVLLTLYDMKTNPNYQILRSVRPGSVRNGFHKTPYSIKNAPLPGNWGENGGNPVLDGVCFDYYIVSVRDNKVVHSQCLSIQPTWMSNFGDLRIGSMMVPGTHNSGAWRGGPPLIRNYALNQDRNFWEQLVYGIRFFDIRVGRYSTGFYINHAFIRCTELVPELQHVANFLKKSPTELVVLNFHEFVVPKDVSRSDHMDLLNLTQNIFGNLIAPYNKGTDKEGPKLNEFWKAKQRVIISYRYPDIVREVPWLWPSVKRNWGNVQKLGDLERYIVSKTSRPILGNPMDALMAELTHTPTSLVTHPTQSLQNLAAPVNRELTDLLRRNNQSDNVNIIATDFFTGNDVINLAIETNFRKLH